MKLISTTLFLLIAATAVAQTDSVTAVSEISKFRDELNADYRDPKKSPLDAKAIRKFKEHHFFPINLRFRTKAILTATPEEGFFDMNTSNGKMKKYRRYGWVLFSIGGIQYKLPIYQSQDLMKTEEYKNYLFLPFTDLTNGKETYSAGRYMGVYIPPTGGDLVVDFNQSYNPYCAYSNNYSCPIVPKENHLQIKVLAGTMSPESE